MARPSSRRRQRRSSRRSSWNVEEPAYICRNTLPWLKAIHAEYAPQGLKIVSVHTPELPQERDPAGCRPWPLIRAARTIRRNIKKASGKNSAGMRSLARSGSAGGLAEPAHTIGDPPACASAPLQRSQEFVHVPAPKLRCLCNGMPCLNTLNMSRVRASP